VNDAPSDGAILLQAQDRGCVFDFPDAAADAVLQACTRIIEAGQGSKTELATARASRGLAYLSKDDPDDAELDAKEALALDPDLALAHYSRGSVYMHKHVAEAAMAELGTAIKLDPNVVNFYDNRASLEIGMARYDEAISDLSQAIALKPDQWIPYHNRRIVLQMANRYADAVLDADKVKQLAPDSAANWNNACWARAIWGQELETALADCDKALAMVPANATSLHSRCFVKFRMKRYDGAAADCAAAIKADPQHFSSLYIHGLAVMRSGQRSEGSHEVDMVKQVIPNIEDIYARYGVKP